VSSQPQNLKQMIRILECQQEYKDVPQVGQA